MLCSQTLDLFRQYLEDSIKTDTNFDLEDIYKFGGKFNAFYVNAEKLILLTLEEAYKEILNREEGTAFSLPRDQKVWSLVENKFLANLRLVKSFNQSTSPTR